MSPAEVVATWAALRPFYEPLVRDDRYLPNLSLMNPAEAGALSFIGSLIKEEEAFFARHDYAWATADDAYNMSIEAPWQARLLGMLAVWWELVTKPDPRPLQGLSDLVVRVVFNFDVRTGAPLTPPGASKPTFILMPLGFVEEALLLLRAASAKGSRRTAALRTLVLKALAPELAVEPEDTRQLRILERVAPLHLRFFKAVLPYADGLEWTDGEGDLSYAVLDFVMAHEAAHALAGHSAADLERYIETESEADSLALDIYGVSYGRRMARLDRSPMARAMALLGGSPVFFAIVQTMDRLRLDLYEHLTVVEPEAGWPTRTAKLREAAERFNARAASARADLARRTKYFLAAGDDVLNLGEVIQLEDLLADIGRLGADAKAETVKLGPNTLREFRKIASLLPRMVGGPLDLPPRPMADRTLS